MEHGIDLTASYDLGEDEEVDAYRYANMYGETEIADYLKEKMSREANEGKQEKVAMDDELIKAMGDAVISGDIDKVKDLLASNEGLINVVTPMGTWLHDAASYEQYDIAKYLIDCGIDVNVIGGIEEAGAIVSAIFEGNYDIVKLLYDNGAEFDVSSHERNPLFVAIYNGHFEIVRFLVEHGIDLTASYEIGQYDNVDAYRYANMYGETEIADYLKEKMSIEGDKEKQSKERDVLGRLMAVYESRKLESQLDKQTFIKHFKEGVKDIYPKLKEKYDDESIYGISFEIANTVQKIYAEDYNTIVYLNTEENYKEAIEDCEEDEMSYYRFCAWAEWSPESVPSDAFDELQDYLWENGFGFYNDMTTDKEKELSEEVKEWYEDAEDDIEDLLEEENKNIRFWLAEALGQLRKEGFWAQQENADIYVIPFEGEDEISDEELIETFQLMDQGCHGKEYLEYLEDR